MAFKLKLKVPSAPPPSDSTPDAKISKPSKTSKSKASKTTASKTTSGPKLKLKLPDAKASSGIPKLKLKTSAPPNAVKKEMSASSSSPKKLKISLKKTTGSSDLKLKLKPPSVEPNSSSSSATANSSAIPEIIQHSLRSIPKVRIKPTRVPGDGYDSEAPDVEDDPLIEQGFIIRFLEDVNLDHVHNASESGDFSDINIKWITKEKAIVNVKGTLYSARLIDLPTITEIYKTVDKKNIFKTLDICQILLVIKRIVPTDLSMERDFEIPSDMIHHNPIYNLPNIELKPSRMVYKNGINYPFEDIYRRFRSRKLDHRVLEDIQLKVDELIRLDSEAEEIQFEVVDLNNKKTTAANGSNSHNNITSNNQNAPISTGVGTPSATTPRSGFSGTPREMSESPAIMGEDEDEEMEEVDLEEELAKALEDDDMDEDEVVESVKLGTIGERADDDEGEVEGEEDDEDEEEEEDEDDDEDEDEDDEDDGEQGRGMLVPR